jgi:DNA-binding PadR family transcriptional regulator
MFGTGHDFKGCKISPMQLVILLILRERPMYGYEVLKELRDRFDGVWTPQTGSIYPALKRMAEHGLVTSEQRDGTDYYSISGEGTEWLLEKLHHTPRDIRMITRYLQILDRATADIGQFEDVEPIPGRFSEVFEDDSSDISRRAKKLRLARERIAQHLANIDKELEELEEEQSNGGKIK